MKNSLADVGVVDGDELAGLLVERDQRPGVRIRHIFVVRLGVAGAEVDEIAIDEARATRRVVRPDFLPGQQIVSPEDVGVGRVELDRRPGHELADRPVAADFELVFDRLGQILGLVEERAVVAVVEAVGVEAENFAMAGDGVNAVAVDRRRRADAELMVVGFALHFGNDQLPEKLAVGLVETHQHILVADVFRIARRGVVRADEDFAARDDRIAVGVRAEPDRPFHAARFRIGALRRIKPDRQALSHRKPCSDRACRPIAANPGRRTARKLNQVRRWRKNIRT